MKTKRVLLIILAALLIITSVACTKTEPSADQIGETDVTENDAAENDPTEEQTEPENDKYPDGVKIALSDDGITVDGEAIPTDDTADVYAANDIVYYHDGQDFTYGDGDENDAHSQTEADAHTVVHIAKAGTYVVSGKLSCGQIAVDLGDDAEENPEAVVTLVLDNADITCTVAPAVIFYKVYECGEYDETTAAGANIVLSDGSENTLNGSYVAKIYKSVTLSEDGSEIVDSKKLHKYDGTLYSKMTMTISGEDGVLNVNAENEGIDSELHLVINGGNINIVSGDDGINTNEDGVSNTVVNGGTVHIRVDGKQGEGDGIDSNGWLTINGGTVIAEACSTSGDAGIDSDNGIHLNGGTVIASGNMYDAIDESEQNYIVFTFAAQQRGGKTYQLKNADGDTVIECAPTNAFTYLVVSSPELTEGEYSLECDGEKLLVSSGNAGGMRGARPDGMGRGAEDISDMLGIPESLKDEFNERFEELYNEFTERAEEYYAEHPDERPAEMGGRGNGAPVIPNGEMNGFGGDRPDGMPEPPDGFDMQNGQPPEIPNGMGGMGGFGGGQNFDSSDASETFTVTAGGNFFTVQGSNVEMNNKFYKLEDFAGIVINESTAGDVLKIAYIDSMLATSYGGLCELPSENGYIQIKFYGSDLVVGSIEEVDESSLTVSEE